MRRNSERAREWETRLNQPYKELSLRQLQMQRHDTQIEHEREKGFYSNEFRHWVTHAGYCSCQLFTCKKISMIYTILFVTLMYIYIIYIIIPSGCQSQCDSFPVSIISMNPNLYFFVNTYVQYIGDCCITHWPLNFVRI